MVHRILSTNSFLFKIGIKTEDVCNFCHTDTETLEHLFYNCEYVKSFWSTVEHWLSLNCEHINDIQLSIIDIIFGFSGKIEGKCILDFVILLAKYYSYRCKYNDEIPLIQSFKHLFSFWHKVEKQIEYTNCNWDYFDKRWKLYYNMLQD